MAIQFSEAVMKAMGFRRFAEGEEIVGAFSSITVFEVRGVTLSPETTEVSSGIVAGLKYGLAVSSSVNSGCIALMNVAFIDDEEKWKTETKCQGPFVLVVIGPTSEQKCTSGYVTTNEDGSTTTYNCFPDARAELAQLESWGLASIISALTCVLSEDAHYVALRKVRRESVGRTSSGMVFHDIRMEAHGEAYVSYKLDSAQLSEKLGSAKCLASSLNPKASRFFALGIAEQDQLKRFLYLFLALEVETHAVFGRIKHLDALKKLFDGGASRGQSITKLLQNQVGRLTNLFDRFVWCAACAWTELTDADIAQFKALKHARDAIAHGSASEPPPGFAHLAELLAHKVLWRAR